VCHTALWSLCVGDSEFARQSLCCCRVEKKPTVAVSAVSVESFVENSRPLASAADKQAMSALSKVESQPIVGSLLSPVDVSGIVEEWETASEGSDGGLHPRKHTVHRDDLVKCIADTISKPCVEPDACNSCSHGGNCTDASTHLSPCASGVPLRGVIDVVMDRSWKDSCPHEYHRDVGTVNVQCDLSFTVSTNTDSADVMAPSSRLFGMSYSDAATKQSLIQDAVVRLGSATQCSSCFVYSNFLLQFSCHHI